MRLNYASRVPAGVYVISITQRPELGELAEAS
jgi:hypothetical protein